MKFKYVLSFQLNINHKIVYVKSKKKWEICEVDADNIENDQQKINRNLRRVVLQGDNCPYSKEFTVRLRIIYLQNTIKSSTINRECEEENFNKW